jgi:CBS domain-containing protein
MAWMAADTNQTLPAGSLLMVIVTPHSRADLFLRCIDGLRVAGDALFSSNPPINITAISSFDIWQKIHASNLYLTPFVTAAEIMQPVTSSICDNENLEKAIDELTLNNTSWLPVVDKEQELVGEISLYELIQVCFPRHILWMDDINPLLQFETFKNVLFNESFTWLTEIINYHVATIQHDEPAVLAIIQMTKLETHHAYVLNNKTLTGIITLPHIAKVILRQ